VAVAAVAVVAAAGLERLRWRACPAPDSSIHAPAPVVAAAAVVAAAVAVAAAPIRART